MPLLSPLSWHWQTTTPGFTGGTFTAYSQTDTTVTLTVIRPLAHATHPIKATGATSVIFATGPSAFDVPIDQHDDNRAVGVGTNMARAGGFEARALLHFPQAVVPNPHSCIRTSFMLCVHASVR
jgi:hypothetical protein